jgi:hypothetical protein
VLTIDARIMIFFSINILFLGCISCVYQIQVVLSPLIWFISGKNMLYPGRICAYEAYKSLRTVTLSCLMLFNGLQFYWLLLIVVIAVHGTVTEFKSPQFQEQISLLHISIYLYFIDTYTYMLIIIYRDIFLFLILQQS